MKNSQEVSYGVMAENSQVQDFVKTCEIRVLQELAHQFGIAEPNTHSKVQIANARKTVAQRLESGGVDYLRKAYHLPSDISFSDTVEFLKQDIVAQLHSMNWEQISAFEQKRQGSVLHLPKVYARVSSFIPSAREIDFESQNQRFFERLPMRARCTFAEAFGVPFDSIGSCFTDEGLAFLQEKYSCPEKTTFPDFSSIFQHCLASQIPAAESWRWIEEFESCRGRQTHAKGLFYKTQIPRQHKVREAKPCATLAPLSAVEHAIVIANAKQPQPEVQK